MPSRLSVSIDKVWRWRSKFHTMRMLAHVHHEQAENALTQARDFAAAERTFGSEIKLVVALTLVAGNYILRAPESIRPRLDQGLGGVLFGVALILLGHTLFSYLRFIKRYRHDEKFIGTPPWAAALLLVVSFLALAITIAEFIVPSVKD